MIANEELLNKVTVSSDVVFLEQVYKKFKHNVQIMSGLVSNSFLPEKIMEKLVSHSDAAVRESLAERHKWSSQQITHYFGLTLTVEEQRLRTVTPPHVLEQLADDKDVNVVKAVLLNQSSPAAALHKITEKADVDLLKFFIKKEYYGDDENINKAICDGLLKLTQLDSSYELQTAESRNTPSCFVEYLYEHGDSEIVKTLMVNSNVPVVVAEHFLSTLTAEYVAGVNKTWLKGLAANLPDESTLLNFYELLTTVASHVGVGKFWRTVSEGVFANPHTPSHVLEELYFVLKRSKPGYFKYVSEVLPLLENPNTPSHILHGMCVSEEKWLEDNIMVFTNALCSNPNTPFHSLMDEKFLQKIRTAYVVWKMSQHELFTVEHLDKIVHSNISSKVLKDLEGMVDFTEEHLTYIALTAGGHSKVVL